MVCKQIPPIIPPQTPYGKKFMSCKVVELVKINIILKKTVSQNIAELPFLQVHTWIQEQCQQAAQKDSSTQCWCMQQVIANPLQWQPLMKRETINQDIGNSVALYYEIDRANTISWGESF